MKFGSAAPKCFVCTKSVYPQEKLTVDKHILHKWCFKCAHCQRTLTISNFAAVNQKLYCKTHYLELFRSSGGSYEVFGDAGFKKKSGRPGSANISALAGGRGPSMKVETRPKPSQSEPPAPAVRRKSFNHVWSKGGKKGSWNAKLKDSPSKPPASSASTSNGSTATKAKGSGTIVVVGSANMDYFFRTSAFPKPGETIEGSQFFTGFGGKGANQAVMAAKLGSKVTFVGKLGMDSNGTAIKDNFSKNGVDSAHIATNSSAATGVASIIVDGKGENQIVMVPGANATLTKADVERASIAIRQASVVVCQNEVPVEATLAALKIAKQGGATTIFNPAPGRRSHSFPAELFKLVDILVPNQSEAKTMTGMKDDSACSMLFGLGVASIVLTEGSKGASYYEKQGAKPVRIKGSPVRPDKVVDTAGAGDCFIGSMSHFIAAGDTIEAAAQKACKIAALSVQRKGCQESYPSPKDLPAGVMI